ncbi:uncharacterized protein DEA37_0004331 [Paragonimus westermani]|uniref:Uncharacterized protein n=1 Tax=Paragonimus westermani TaxID=34504 RepID=A0A5J4NA61_9TREM|nr:uncharacterized protein DEA37_0004331 [Paragonimus westermani]
MHIGEPGGCLLVNPEDVLKSLRQVKDADGDSRLIVVNVCDAQSFRAGQLLTAIPLNCQTRAMTKRAIVERDTMFDDQDDEQGCSALTLNDHCSCTQICRFSKPPVVVYDQEGFCPFCDKNSPIEFFIKSLLIGGNDVYFMECEFAFGPMCLECYNPTSTNWGSVRGGIRALFGIVHIWVFLTNGVWVTENVCIRLCVSILRIYKIHEVPNTNELHRNPESFRYAYKLVLTSLHLLGFVLGIVSQIPKNPLNKPLIC